MEFISVFDIFKIGIGPSSSHTMGPWRAAQQFLHRVGSDKKIRSLQVELFGSLAKTGIGHGTDMAVILGLSNEDPVTIPVSNVKNLISVVRSKKLLPVGKERIPFDPDKDIIFHYDQTLPFHPNGMRFTAKFSDSSPIEETYYSIGGGFVVQEGSRSGATDRGGVPFPIHTGAELLKWCRQERLPVSGVVFENEKAFRSPEKIHEQLIQIWETMKDCVYRGCHTDGELPGGLRVKRRASEINRRIFKTTPYEDPNKWLSHMSHGPFSETLSLVSCFALAVNEENASYGRVVTAPTNGAAGVIPAVLFYYRFLCPGTDDDGVVRFLLTAGELGSIFKKGSTISAAMGGCQAEIGVSSAMAAGALTECLGGSPEQVLMAAEIAMEHHLGLTCDPIGGLVQIPCIERNTMGAIKAITAAQIALDGDPASAKVSLDDVIRTMWQTAKDMSAKYKETSEGGLAAHVSVNLAEC